jgi:hypothetical protein
MLMGMANPLARIVNLLLAMNSLDVINPYQSPQADEFAPTLFRRLLNSGFVNEIHLGMPIGGIGGILAGELWGFFFGEVRDGLDIFLYGDWGYVTGSTIGGVVGLAIVAKRWLATRPCP